MSKSRVSKCELSKGVSLYEKVDFWLHLNALCGIIGGTGWLIASASIVQGGAWSVDVLSEPSLTMPRDSNL